MLKTDFIKHFRIANELLFFYEESTYKTRFSSVLDMIVSVSCLVFMYLSLH